MIVSFTYLYLYYKAAAKTGNSSLPFNSQFRTRQGHSQIWISFFGGYTHENANNGVYIVYSQDTHLSSPIVEVLIHTIVRTSSNPTSGVRSQNGSSLISQLGLHSVLRNWIPSLLYSIPVAPEG